MSLFDAMFQGVRRFAGLPSSFRRTIDPIIRHFGLSVLHDDDESVLLRVRWRGETYQLFVAAADAAHAYFAAESRIEFPPRQLPEDVSHALLDMNRKLPRCDYGAVDTRHCSKFVTRMVTPLLQLDVDEFAEIVDTLLLPIEVLDQMLLRRGYAR